MKQLITATFEHHARTGFDLAAHMGDLGHLITLSFLATPTALFIHVIQRVMTVLRGQQLQLLTRLNIGFVAGADFAGNQGQVGTCNSNQVTASV